MREITQVKCPVCGYKMPVYFDKTAECSGVIIFCKGRNCHADFELKIKGGKQVK